MSNVTAKILSWSCLVVGNESRLCFGSLKELSLVSRLRVLLVPPTTRNDHNFWLADKIYWFSSAAYSKYLDSFFVCILCTIHLSPRDPQYSLRIQHPYKTPKRVYFYKLGTYGENRYVQLSHIHTHKTSKLLHCLTKKQRGVTMEIN